MSEMFKKTARGYLIDHHSPSSVEFTHLNLNQYKSFLKEGNINNLMVYTKDHWGYSYYDTRVGTKHPKLNIDLVKELKALLKSEKIEFNAYYCLEYDHLICEQHPEWAIKDEEGNKVQLQGRLPKWNMPCYETEYRFYVLEQLKEVVERYRPDSLFLDIFGKTLCYCNSCQQKFVSRFGYDLPKQENREKVRDEFVSRDLGDKGRDVNLFLEESAASMLLDIHHTLKPLDPTLKITINFSALYPKHIRDLLDYQFTEPWAGNWLSAAYSRDTAKYQYPQLGPGDVSEIYNYRSDDVYKLAAAQIAAQNCRVFMYSGSQRVDGSLEMTESHKVGKAYAQIKNFEQYLGSRSVVADIVIIQSESSVGAIAGNQVVINAIGRCKHIDLHRKAILGAMKMASLSGRTWKILPEQEAIQEGFGLAKIVILAGVFCVIKPLQERLENFVSQGGKIIADGQVGLYELNGSLKSNFSLQNLLGCHFVKVLEEYQNVEWGGFIEMVEDNLWQFMPKTTPAIPSIQYEISPIPSENLKVLGKIKFPITKVTDKTWINWWCPPPQKEEGLIPAVIEHQFGKGICQYWAFDFFAAVNEAFFLLENIFLGSIAKLLKDPVLYLEVANGKALSITAYKMDASPKYIVHQINHLAEFLNGQSPRLEGGTLWIQRQSIPLKKAKLVYSDCLEWVEESDNLLLDSRPRKKPEDHPTETALQIGEAGDYYKIKLPSLEIHQIIVLEV